MPRIKQYEKKYMVDDLYDWIHGQMRRTKTKQSELGRILNLSQQNLSYRLEHQTLTYMDVISIFEYFQADEETILKFTKTKGA